MILVQPVKRERVSEKRRRMRAYSDKFYILTQQGSVFFFKHGQKNKVENKKLIMVYSITYRKNYPSFSGRKFHPVKSFSCIIPFGQLLFLKQCNKIKIFSKIINKNLDFLQAYPRTV